MSTRRSSGISKRCDTRRFPRPDSTAPFRTKPCQPSVDVGPCRERARSSTQSSVVRPEDELLEHNRLAQKVGARWLGQLRAGDWPPGGRPRLFGLYSPRLRILLVGCGKGLLRVLLEPCLGSTSLLTTRRRFGVTGSRGRRNGTTDWVSGYESPAPLLPSWLFWRPPCSGLLMKTACRARTVG